MDHHGAALSDSERAVFDDLAAAWSSGPPKRTWLLGIGAMAVGFVAVIVGLSTARIGYWPVLSLAGWAAMVGGGLVVHHWSAEAITAVVRRHADDLLTGRIAPRDGQARAATPPRQPWPGSQS